LRLQEGPGRPSSSTRASTDRTEDFPFVDGEALDATRIDVVADTQGMDLAVVAGDRL